MTTNHHTAFTSGFELTSANLEAPLAQLDAAIDGTGAVIGPASATDGHLMVFDGTTGKLSKDGGEVPSTGVARSGSTTDAHLAVWNGSSADSLKDGGAVPAGGGGGGGDYVKITETILASPAASIDITSIPGTYRNLKIFFEGRSDTISSSKIVYIRINADAGRNYYTETEQFYGTMLIAGEALTSSSIIAAYIPPSNADNGLSGVAEITVFNYSLTTFVKHLSISAQQASGRVTGGTAGYPKAAWWNSTSAITRITLTLSANNFDTGTIVSVYGMN